MKTFALLFLAVAASGCPDIKTDPSGESPKGPTVEFDPANKIIPFPNNLLLDPMTGKVNLPSQCGESPTAKALREGVLNKLDGFGTFEGAITVTFTEPVEMASLEANLVMYKRVSAGTAVDPASAQKLPLLVQASKTPRFDANCMNPTMVDQAIIIPRVPLDQKSTYVIALVDGVKTAMGTAFQPSFTWSLVRSTENPAQFDDSGNFVSDATPLDPNVPEQLEQLKGINLLWNAHAQGMKFLKDKGTDGKSVLLAWELNTQTTTDPLDSTVAGSPASKVIEGLTPGQVPPLFGASLPGPASGGPAGETAEQFLIRRLPGACQNGTPAGPLPCQAVANVMIYAIGSKQYQIDTPNPYTGPLAEPIPGPWADAVSPSMVKNESIRILVTTPADAGAPFPTLVFQHGLGRSNFDALAIASQLAAINIATVAIDAVGHGNRAVRVSNSGPCVDDPASPRDDKGPDPTDFRFIRCYAPFLSPNLAVTRDGIRQTVLDLQRVVLGVKACGSTACGALKVDPAHIVYMGQSLGGIIGSTAVSVAPDIKAAVLNVPGVGWADILENTQNLGIRCNLVDGLIDAGILVGDKSNLMVAPPTGLCTTDAWKTQPGYRQFALIGRWVLDPADPANFTRKLAIKRIFIQKVDNDAVVPNIATNNEGALVGLMEQRADCGLPPAAPPAPPFTPSAALLTNSMSSKFLKYVSVGVNDASCPAGIPGNTFAHGSLLSPGNPPTVPGQLATGRMQTDALFFLNTNK